MHAGCLNEYKTQQEQRQLEYEQRQLEQEKQQLKRWTVVGTIAGVSHYVQKKRLNDYHRACKGIAVNTRFDEARNRFVLEHAKGKLLMKTFILLELFAYEKEKLRRDGTLY